MKNLQKRLNHLQYFLLVVVLLPLTGCHKLLHEEELIVMSAKTETTGEYKYSYHIKAFPTYLVLYSNNIYCIGDTLKYCQ